MGIVTIWFWPPLLFGRWKFCIIFNFHHFFRKFAHIKWIELGNNFRHEFTYLFSFSWFRFFLKSTFSHSTKKTRSRWVFIVQIWFTYRNEALSIRKRNWALFFSEFKSEWFFISLLIEKSDFRFFRHLFDLSSILHKKCLCQSFDKVNLQIL